MHPAYPLPIDMKVRDLQHADLKIRCPSCGRELHCGAYNMELQFPPDMLLIRYVVRHVCQRCSRPGRPMRSEGWIEPWPQSGAEGGDGPSKARSG